jgi:hypothetical protein
MARILADLAQWVYRESLNVCESLFVQIVERGIVDFALDLGFGEHNTILCHLGLESSWSLGFCRTQDEYREWSISGVV